MGKSYGSEPVHLKKAELTEPMFLAIGKLVRAMAEIEDMVDLHICNLVGLSESQTMVILGRTAVTRKLEIAERLALLRDDAAIQVHKSVFDDNYNDLVNCRNAVAHGTLMGEANGKLYFLASPPVSNLMRGARLAMYSALRQNRSLTMLKWHKGYFPTLNSACKWESCEQNVFSDL